PVASLDASRRGQVINLVNEISRRQGIALVVVSHDMIPIALMTESIMAMYRGRVVEVGPTRDVIRHPSHPYAKLLVEAVRTPLHGEGLDENVREETPGGCPYSGRCAEYRRAVCDVAPALKPDPSRSRSVACHLRGTENASRPDLGRQPEGELR